MVLDPLEDTADQISLQTRHAVAGTEAYTQTQFSPIDSSIDLTGFAVEDSYSTMAEANALNQDWVLQDIAVAEEQVALNAPQQPTLTGFASVAEGASLETMDVSQFEAYETGLDFGMDFQENAQVATANLSIEPTAITETTWSVKPEADFTLVEQTVTQPTGISVNDNLMVLDDAFDFADVVPIQELSLINGNVTRTGEPIAQSATALQESYQINEYDEVVVDFDSGTLALDATSAPDVLLSSIGTVANEPVQSAQQEIENETTVANLEEEVSTEEALSTTSSAATDGMISLAEVVGSYLAPALKEQGNILGLSAENQVLPVGVMLPFYDLALEKIKVVAALPLEIENSALLYLEIEPFYALFGFVNNQFKLLHTFQKNVLTEVPDASLMLGLNATSTTEGSIYKLTIGLWEALVTVTPEQVNLVKIVNHA
jgi:hypothetical protein